MTRHTTSERFITSFEEAKEYLNGKRERPLPGKATYLRDLGYDGPCGAMQGISVYYHKTPVVTYWGNGEVELNTGGFYTATTKRRINQYIPDGYYVFQEDYGWYLRTPDCIDDLVFESDRVMLRPDGSVQYEFAKTWVTLTP